MYIISAQSAPCGNPDIAPPSTPPENSANCFSPFTPADIYEDCTPVYVNVNAHVFVNTDCNGSAQIIGTSQLEAYAWIENYINQANSALANNPAQWGLNQAPACMPFRWVLNGVYMHCKSNSTENDIHSRLINGNSEINFFFTDCLGGNCSGKAYGSYLMTQGQEIGIFNHEVGHIFGLNHSHDMNDFPNGPCDDTDPHLTSWDKNCNGVLQNIPGSSADEVDILCWAYIGNWALGNGTEPDKNFNGIHDCEEVEPCTISPCCNWANINNNIMAYCQFQSAFTPCQSQRMLEVVHQFPDKCQYVEAVGGACAPPAAFIGQTAKDQANTSGYCTETLVLSASFNETRYKFDLMLAGSQVLVFSTNWVNDAAENILFSIDPNSNPPAGQILLHLQQGTGYIAKLTVENPCNEQDEFTYPFTTPSKENCDQVYDPGSTGVPMSLAINPNPTNGSVNISFAATGGETFSVKAVNMLTGNISTLISAYSATAGNNNMSLNMSSLSLGQYTLKVQSAQKLYQGTFLKL